MRRRDQDYRLARPFEYRSGRGLLIVAGLTRALPFAPRAVGRATYDERLALALLLGAALLVRILSAILFCGEIDTEGTEYARIAQNLLAGKGYVGIATPGTELFLPPLFPLLIAGVTLIVGDAEAAGRIINIVSGTLLALPVYFIARRMFGKKAAFAAAAIAVLHPFFISFSTTVFSEPTFLTLLLTAIYATMQAASHPTWRALAACGAVYGAAYLVRPESIVYMLVGFAHILIARLLLARDKPWPAVAGRLLLMPFVFLVIATPYVVWVSTQTGHLRLEGKSPLNLATELRMAKGVSADEAGMAVDETGTERGVWNQPNVVILESYRASMSDFLLVLKRKTATVLRAATSAFASSPEFGCPALFALGILGLFGRAWRPSFALDQLHLLSLAALSVIATYFIYYTSLRFYLLFPILFAIWAPAGGDSLKSWAQRSAASFGLNRRRQRMAAAAVWWCAVAAVVVPAAAWATKASLAMRATRPVEVAAESMAALHVPLRIADTSTSFAFHANAEFFWLPYCNEETALRYLKARDITHVVLHSEAADTRPYLRKWLENGVPEGRLVKHVMSGTGEQIQVFELRRESGS